MINFYLENNNVTEEITSNQAVDALIESGIIFVSDIHKILKDGCGIKTPVGYVFAKEETKCQEKM